MFSTVGLHPHDAVNGVDSIVDLLDLLRGGAGLLSRAAGKRPAGLSSVSDVKGKQARPERTSAANRGKQSSRQDLAKKMDKPAAKRPAARPSADRKAPKKDLRNKQVSTQQRDRQKRSGHELPGSRCETPHRRLQDSGSEGASRSVHRKPNTTRHPWSNQSMKTSLLTRALEMFFWSVMSDQRPCSA